MKIAIHQRLLSIGDKHDIYLNGEKKYLAKRSLFSSITRLKDQSSTLTATIKREVLKGITSHFTLDLENNSKCYFKVVSARKGIWELKDDTSTFILYGHEGYAYSLYQDEKQIAAAKKNEIVFLGKDKFEIEADYDVDVEKVIAIFLIIDRIYFRDRESRGPALMKLAQDGKPRNWQWSPTEK